MNKKIIFSVLMAIFFIGLFIGILEKIFIWWQVLVGLLTMFFVSLNMSTQINEIKSSAWIFIITAIYLLLLYLLGKINALGVGVGAIIGLISGLMIYYGWIILHKPFSREEYLEK